MSVGFAFLPVTVVDVGQEWATYDSIDSPLKSVMPQDQDRRYRSEETHDGLLGQSNF